MEDVKISLPDDLFDILQENADLAGLTVGEYASYLIKRLLKDTRYGNEPERS